MLSFCPQLVEGLTLSQNFHVKFSKHNYAKSVSYLYICKASQKIPLSINPMAIKPLLPRQNSKSVRNRCPRISELVDLSRLPIRHYNQLPPLTPQEM